jgi:hypothetical protein
MKFGQRKDLLICGLLLSLFVAIALVLQLRNFSHYNVYPDSYQSIVVAQNLKQYHALAAPMGQNGLIYPDFFGWTRPLYPLLILFFSLSDLSFFSAAHIVNIVAGCLSVLAAYGFINAVLHSKKSGLVAAFLMAISYNHIIWSGFIFTESLGVLMLTLALWRLWSQRQKPENWFTKYDILTGAIFALAILTRYEYIILLLPATLLAGKTFSIKRSLSIAATALGIVVVILALLHPFTGDFSWVWGQIKDYVIVLIATLIIIGLGLLLYKYQKLKITRFEFWAVRIAAAFLILFSAFVIFDHSLFPALRNFATNDPLITLVALCGMMFMLFGKKREYETALLVFAGCVIMGLVYYRINPHMDRYIAHMLPLLLIPASYGITRILKSKYRPIVIYLLALLVCLQVIKSWNGLHKFDNGLWFKPGYEEVSAKKLNHMQLHGNLIVASMPEPYYLFTGQPTQSIADHAPYLFAPVAPGTKLTIVDDESMRAIFPGFSNFIDKNLKQFQTAQYPVNQPLRYINTIAPEQQPVRVYQLTYKDLEMLLDNSNPNR